MKRCGIVGGETHIGEISGLAGSELELVGAVVSDEHAEWAGETFGCPIYQSLSALISGASPDILAVANENDLRAPVILEALEAGCDLIVDKPLAITMSDHQAIVERLRSAPERRVLNLLTLRGHPAWRAARDAVAAEAVGVPAFCHIRMAVRLKRDLRPEWFLDVTRSGGLFLDLLIHGLDMVEWTMDDRIVAMTVAGTGGCLDLDHAAKRVVVANHLSDAAGPVALAEPESIVADWLARRELVPQAASIRANRLALIATDSANRHERVTVPPEQSGW